MTGRFVVIFIGSLIVVFLVSYFLGFYRGYGRIKEVKRKMENLKKFERWITDEQR